MKENEFRAWLAPQIHPKTVNDYVSDIKRIERYYGDLDRLYETDRLAALIDELRCTPTEQPLHWIPINGDVRNGDLNARERGQTLSGISQGGRGGAAMTLRERVLAAIREQPGITINELVRRLDGPGRPAVYHRTWVLCLRGVIVRHRAETSRAYLHYPVARGAPLGDGSLHVIVTRWHDG